MEKQIYCCWKCTIRISTSTSPVLAYAQLWWSSTGVDWLPHWKPTTTTKTKAKIIQKLAWSCYAIEMVHWWCSLVASHTICRSEMPEKISRNMHFTGESWWWSSSLSMYECRIITPEPFHFSSAHTINNSTWFVVFARLSSSCARALAEPFLPECNAIHSCVAQNESVCLLLNNGTFILFLKERNTFFFMFRVEWKKKKKNKRTGEWN